MPSTALEVPANVLILGSVRDNLLETEMKLFNII